MKYSSRDSFEFWLAHMDERLKFFLKTLPTGLQEELNFSENSLSSLEEWALSQHLDTTTLLKPDAKQLVDGLATYVGETFRRCLGGRWDIELSNTKDVYFGLPRLVGIPGQAAPVCPHTLATSFADRRTGQLFYSVLQGLKKRLPPR